MRRSPFVVALLSLAAASADAQSCIGLPATGTAYAAIGFEGTDGRMGTSHALALHGARLGVQLERERYTRSGGSDYTWDAQGTWEVGNAPGERAASLCAVGGGNLANSRAWATFTDEVNGDLNARHRRVRAPVGIAFGRTFSLVPDEPGALTVTPFVQPMLLVQRERLWASDMPELERTRTRGAFAGTVGVGIAMRPFVLRTTVSYATLPEYSLAREHNWMVLSVQLGAGF